MTTLAQIRQQFPALEQQINGVPLVYLDNAATTHKPVAVIKTLEHYYSRINANVHRASHALSAAATQQFEQARETVATFLNAASSREIIWTRGTTEAINLVANSFGESLNTGDEILLSTLEHHANIVPWQMLAERRGLTIKIIPLTPEGDLDLQAYELLLSTRTRLVAISHVSNALGSINPIDTLIKKAHAAGARVLVDGAQALPHFSVDLQALDADFYVFSGHKLYAPTGIGVLYGKAELLEQMPPWQGGGEMIERVSFSGTSFNQIPFKFEAGTPNIAGAIGLAEAITWLQQQDRQLLSAHEDKLMQLAVQGCEQLKGFTRIGQPQQSVSLLSFTLAGVHQQDVGQWLDQKGIAVRCGHHCAMPLMQSLNLPGTIRASFAFYNTEAEVGQFIQALDEIIRQSQVNIPLSESEQLLPRLLKCRGWNERYREIMLAGKSLAELPTALKTDNVLVKGCESQTWLIAERGDDGRFNFQADSDARIIRGLLALLLEIFNHKNAQQIQQIDLNKIFSDLDLQKHLSPSRGNGLRAVADKIYQIARQDTPAPTKLERE